MYENSGTILQALLGGNDPNRVDPIILEKPFSLHNERARVGLRTGGLTIDSALSKFNRVNEQSPSVESSLRYASQTQSIKRAIRHTILGTDYDFCTEILDSTRPPYSMECIQKEFLRVGGKKEGTLYPSVPSMTIWNSQPYWLDIKKILERIQIETRSTDRVVQEQAIIKFYGNRILESDVKKERLPGVEIFWFSHSNIFLGRRIRPSVPHMNDENARIPISFVFFTQFALFRTKVPTKFRIISDSNFGIEFNRPLGIQYTNGTHVNTANSLVVIDRFPLTTFTANAKVLEDTRLSGYWSQTGSGRHFKLETQRDAEKWLTLNPLDLSLTQDPYAPIVSFQVYRDPHSFGADFNFADKRMALMMKWSALTGTPGWLYTKGPLNLPVVKFRPDSSMRMTSFKMYSFMTMTILMTFNALPNNFINMEEYISMPGTLGKIAIRVIGNGTYGQGVLQLYYEGENRTTTVKTIRKGLPYLIVLRVNRTSETDIYSVNGLSIGVQELSILQENPSIEYTQMIVSNPIAFSNPESNESRSMIIGNGNIDISWVRLYDYYLSRDGIKREINI